MLKQIKKENFVIVKDSTLTIVNHLTQDALSCKLLTLTACVHK